MNITTTTSTDTFTAATTIQRVFYGDPFSSSPAGDLTAKQYAALLKVARLSPGYFFTVLRYNGTGSKATHVAVRRNRDASAYESALVGHDCAQYYDRSKETEQVVKRIAHRIYRRSGVFFA